MRREINFREHYRDLVERYHRNPERLDKVFYAVFEEYFDNVDGDGNIRIISGWGTNPFIIKRSDPNEVKDPTVVKIYKRVRGVTISLCHTISDRWRLSRSFLLH